MWAFWDDDGYKERPNLVQLKGSTTSTACTTPNVLFPFFAVHIQTLIAKTSGVNSRAIAFAIRSKGPFLGLFGRRVVSSPGFQLVPA